MPMFQEFVCSIVSRQILGDINIKILHPGSEAQDRGDSRNRPLCGLVGPYIDHY